jgi:site-specific recombinase XerD
MAEMTAPKWRFFHITYIAKTGSPVRALTTIVVASLGISTAKRWRSAMAQLKTVIKKNGSKFYYSIITSVKWSKPKNIPLNTKSKVEARIRHQQVQKVEKDIKDGLDFTFPWYSDSKGCTSIKILVLKDTVNEYLDYRIGKVRPSTIRRDAISLNQLMKYIGKSKPINKLSSKDIDGRSGLIRSMQNETMNNERKYKDTGINISLRHIRTFFNWLHKKVEYIDNEITFDKLNEGKPLPRYLNENELNQIYNLHWLDDFYKKAFKFYENTGCRPREPFDGELFGDWLIVEVEKSKSKQIRQIKLSDQSKSILLEMHKFRDDYKFSGSVDPNETAYHRLATIMRKVVKGLDIKGKNISLKSFRHTYGIKRVTVSGNIHQVAREMGHSKITTTEIYLQYPEQRRIDDFPSLRKYIENDAKMKENANSATNYSVTGNNFLFSPRL